MKASPPHLDQPIGEFVRRDFAELLTAIAWFWLGASILSSIVMACLLGLSIPSALHALRLDPKIAAGPLTLALADLLTLLFYLSIASLLLKPA